MNIPLGEVDRTLARLWADTAKGDAHASTSTLVVCCATPDELPRARAAIAPLVTTRPCRTITVACYLGAPPVITARVALHINTLRDAEPVGDDIELDVRGAEARTWVPSTLLGLRKPDVPLYVWWVGDLPDNDRLFDHLVEEADVAAVHSCDMDLRDLEQLSRLIELSQGAYVMTDLNWVRLRAWQELTARFFDDPAARAHTRAMRELTVRFTPRENVVEPLSTQAALFAGWIATCLGWDTHNPRWSVSTDGSSTATLKQGEGEAVTVRFIAEEREGVYPGAIHLVGLAAPQAHFEVARSSDDPLVICWSGEGEGLLIPSQCLRIGTPDEPKMLARALERPSRDTVFERSLAAAARLVAPVAPKAPGDV